MAIIEINKKVLISRRGALISGKVIEGQISSKDPISGSLTRPFYGEFKAEFNFPVAIQGRNSILNINGKFTGKPIIAVAGDEILFQAQFANNNTFSNTRIINKNRGKMPLYLLSGSDTLIPENEQLEVLLRQQEQLIKNDAKIKEIWHPKLENIGLVLQGGGVAGAFGVGALGLLDKNQLLSKKYLKSIGCASTGSLSAASLLSGHSINSGNNTNRVAIILETNYLQLKKFADMGKLRAATRQLMKKSAPIKQAVEIALYGKTADVDYVDYMMEKLDNELNFFEKVGLFITGSLTLFGGPIGTLAGGYGTFNLLKSNLKDALAKEQHTFKKFTEIRGSLATLEPTRKKLTKALNLIDVEKHGIKLRVALTSYETGATAYYTEDGTLLYPKYDEVYGVFLDNDFISYQVDAITYDSDNVPLSETATNTDKTKLFIEACLTSSAFPAIFDPKVISFSSKTNPNQHFRETFYDGGIRENLPINEIRKTNVASIIAIHNSPVNTDLITPDGNTATPPFNFGNSAGNYTVTDHGLRALDFMNNEIVQGDMDLERSIDLVENYQLDEVIHIAPNFSVIGLTETNPIRIKLTMFYGYLRAFDALFLAKAKEIQNVTIRNQKIKDAHKLSKYTDQIVLGLSVALQQPIDLAKNALIDLGGNNWKTYKEVCEDQFNRVKPVGGVNPDTYSLKDPHGRIHLKIANIALKTDKAKLYYANKNKVLELYNQRILLAKTKESLPYDNTFYNIFLKETFFNGAWQGADLYPLIGVKNMDYLVCGQTIKRIQNIKGKSFQKGGGNFRVIHYNNKKKGNEARDTFNLRQKLNTRIESMKRSKQLISESTSQRQRLFNNWKKNNFIKN